MTARRVVVHGRVQGVFFRDSLQREAARLRVAGWVRNRNDGAVEAWLEGDEGGVAALVDWCRHGPPRARVDHIDVSGPEAPQGLESFRVTH